MHPRKGKEPQLAVEFTLDTLPVLAVQAIPLVDGDNHRAARLEDEACNMGILLRDLVLRVDHQQHDIARLNGLKRLDYREFFDRLKYLAALAKACRIDQRVFFSPAIELDLDRVARRARQIERDHALLAEQRIDERRFADVWPPHDRQFDAVVRVRTGVVRIRVLLERGRIRFLIVRMEFSRRRVFAKPLKGDLHQIIDPVAVRGGNGVRFAKPEFMKLGNCAAVGHTLGFVHAQEHALSRLAQQAGNIVIVRIEARSRVDQEQHDIGFRDRLPRLASHLVQNAGLGDRLESARIDDDERLVAHPALAIMTIAGQAREIRHERRS